jgi:hypothetical protein
VTPAARKVAARRRVTLVSSISSAIKEAAMALPADRARRPGTIPQPRREDDVLAPRCPGAPPYQEVLEAAYRLGRADGLLAAAFESSLPDPIGTTCRGRGPEEFAEYLWADLAGTAPAGVQVNARVWYLAGMADALGEPAV